MATKTATRRRIRRHSVSNATGAFVDLEYASAKGLSCSLPLIDISMSGISFTFEDELPGIEDGVTLSGAVIRLGDCEIRGDLTVMHLTPHTGTTTLCGALFYPASDTDLVKVKSIIAGIEALGTSG